MWDVSKVLDYLKTLSPAEKLTLKELPLKTVMLLLLVTCQRGQLISLLSLNNIQMLPHIAHLSLDEHTETAATPFPPPLFPPVKGSVCASLILTLLCDVTLIYAK